MSTLYPISWYARIHVRSHSPALLGIHPVLERGAKSDADDSSGVLCEAGQQLLISASPVRPACTLHCTARLANCLCADKHHSARYSWQYYRTNMSLNLACHRLCLNTARAQLRNLVELRRGKRSFQQRHRAVWTRMDRPINFVFPVKHLEDDGIRLVPFDVSRSALQRGILLTRF